MMAGLKDGVKGKFALQKKKLLRLLENMLHAIGVMRSKHPLRMICGSHYIPKGKRLGDDAHIICGKEQVVGIADGVGDWAKYGIDAGQYARELMENSKAVVQGKGKGFIDPAVVMRKAYSKTSSKGSSTACIIALNDHYIDAAIVGDSGFLVVRDGAVIYRSVVQLHDTNIPYQLGASDQLDDPSCAEVVKVTVKSGDVIVAGTDGLFDNLFEDEIRRVVESGLVRHLEPHKLASILADMALKCSESTTDETPFSKASQEAGNDYIGGKRDDITVVVMHILSASA